MRVTVIHNEDAGGAEPRADALLGAIRNQGHDAAYWSSSPNDIAQAIEAPADLIAVVGGDGTMLDVASRLAGRGIPIAVVPAGTANNIAVSLGILDDWRSAIAAWAGNRPRSVNLGWVSGKHGTVPFIESVGCGLIVDLMVRFDADQSQPEPETPREEIGQARRKCHELLPRARPKHYRVELDGQDCSGSYLLVEAMNMGRLGPGLPLASEADTRDGLLDVVLMTEHERDLLSICLEPSDSDLRVTPPELPIRRARGVTIDPGDDQLHVGGEPWPREKQPLRPHGPVQVYLQEQALLFLAPPGNDK